MSEFETTLRENFKKNFWFRFSFKKLNIDKWEDWTNGGKKMKTVDKMNLLRKKLYMVNIHKEQMIKNNFKIWIYEYFKVNWMIFVTKSKLKWN